MYDDRLNSFYALVLTKEKKVKFGFLNLSLDGAKFSQIGKDYDYKGFESAIYAQD